MKDPLRQQPIRQPLVVQPVFVYAIYKRREATSFRPWGGILTEQDAAAERDRIAAELQKMAAGMGIPIQVLPIVSVQTVEQASAVARSRHDVTLMYAASGDTNLCERLAAPTNKWPIMFVRHRSGPAYLLYETAHCRFLRKAVDEFGQPGMDVDDVVVDSYADIAMRLRALHGLKNAMGKRIVAIGGPSGWGATGRKAPWIGGAQMQLDIVTETYANLAERIKRAKANDALVRKARSDAEKYLAGGDVKLETSKPFVENAFLLTEVFRDLLDEAKTDALTINECMGTIMPMSETTACLPLMLLNDDGYMAFCESDFVVIPSGILLHGIANVPVFLNDPTYPHHNVVTLAHCTGPSKMDGKNAEPVRLLTHFESDYGAAPKVEMRKGQKVTNLIPDFASKKWVAFEGEIVDVPFMDICRDQIDVGFKGDTGQLLRQMQGFHWMTCYGSYVDETAYALKKLGVATVRI
jgi:L-fucose isomerase-like protein